MAWAWKPDSSQARSCLRLPRSGNLHWCVAVYKICDVHSLQRWRWRLIHVFRYTCELVSSHSHLCVASKTLFVTRASLFSSLYPWRFVLYEFQDFVCDYETLKSAIHFDSVHNSDTLAFDVRLLHSHWHWQCVTHSSMFLFPLVILAVLWHGNTSVKWLPPKYLAYQIITYVHRRSGRPNKCKARHLGCTLYRPAHESLKVTPMAKTQVALALT